MSKNPGKLMKVVKIDREDLHIFWMTWGISMKVSGIMLLTIILKVTKKQRLTFPPEDILLEKPQWVSNWPNKFNLMIILLKNHILYAPNFFGPFLLLIFLIWDGDSSYLICPVLTPFLFCPCFFVYKLQTENCKKEYVKGFSENISHINCRLWK